MVKSVTTREVEWDEHEQALMLALDEYESMVCSGCGGWLPETTEKEPERGQRWMVTGIKCHVCVAVDKTATAASKNDQQAHLTRWRIERNEGV